MSLVASRRGFLAALLGGAVAAAIPGKAVTVVAPPLAKQLGGFAGSFQIGDVFQIAGKYITNPLTRKDTGMLQNYVVTQVSDSSISFFPHSNVEEIGIEDNNRRIKNYKRQADGRYSHNGIGLRDKRSSKWTGSGSGSNGLRLGYGKGYSG